MDGETGRVIVFREMKERNPKDSSINSLTRGGKVLGTWERRSQKIFWVEGFGRKFLKKIHALLS